MPKGMAILDGDTVVNIIYCSDKEIETDTQKNINGLPVTYGDIYIDGKFYRNGSEVAEPVYVVPADITDLYEKITDMQKALNVLGLAEEDDIDDVS